MNRRRTSEAGFSLLEIMIATAILTLVALFLISMIAASQKIGTMSRERETALSACRAYVEEMRSLSVTAVLLDMRTPADFVPGGVDRLPNASGQVWKLWHENGDTAWLVSGGPGSTVTSTAVSTAFKGELGFNPGRNLTIISGTADATGSNPPPLNLLRMVPVRARLTWTSGRAGTGGGATTETKEHTVHAIFTDP